MNMSRMTEEPMAVFREDSPTLRRIDVAYGRNSARLWLFDVLQATFVFLGVTEDRFSKEQILDLAGTIVSSPVFGALKIGEVLFFLARFKGGAYGRFYGDDSYALVVTEALHRFLEERAEYCARVEREKLDRKIAEEDKQPHVTFEEWKRMKEAKGEKINLTSDIIKSIMK